MTVRRSLWRLGAAGLLLLSAGMGCSICPLVPQPATDAPSPPAAETPGATPPPEPPSTPELPAGMQAYTNPLMGFGLQYPEGWVYSEEGGSVFFAENEDALELADPVDGPVLLALFGSPEDVEDVFGEAASPQDLFDNVKEGLCELGAECEVGDIEAWSFGDVPGVGAELGYHDPDPETAVRGYLVAGMGDGVAGAAYAGAPAGDWALYEPVFRSTFDSLRLFPPEKPEPVDAGAIYPGETQSGTLPAGGLVVWFFEALQGQYVTIRLSAVGDGLDTYLELYDGDEVLIAEDDDSGEGTNSAIGELLIAQTGTYFIHVTPFEGEGDYTLGLEMADEPSGGGEIAYGEAVEAMLPYGVEHDWLFEGGAGDVITITMRATDGMLDSYLELYGPDDDWLAADDDGGQDLDALIGGFEVLADGTYRIAAGSSSLGESGAYELALEVEQR